MANITFVIDIDKVKGVYFNKNGKYNYVSLTVEEDDMFSNHSLEWRDGAAVPDFVMDVVEIIKPKGKELSGVKMDESTREFLSRLKLVSDQNAKQSS